MFLNIRKAAPISSRMTDVSPIQPPTLPIRRFRYESPELRDSMTCLACSAFSGMSISRNAPFKAVRGVASVTRVIPDFVPAAGAVQSVVMWTGHDAKRKALPNNAGFIGL